MNKTGKFIITARRTSGERVYFLSCDSHGERMVPLSYSRALAMTKQDAMEKVQQLSLRLAGLTEWQIEPEWKL